MGFGVSFHQTMRGKYWRLEAPTDEFPMTLTLAARTNRIDLLAHGQKTWLITGTIDADGLASGKSVDGTLAFRPLDGRRVGYRLTFRGDDGRSYELIGQEEWSRLAPIESLTVLPASVYDDCGKETARARVRFDWRRDWAKWLRSFRLWWSPP